MTISEQKLRNQIFLYHCGYSQHSKLSARLAEIYTFEIVEGCAMRATDEKRHDDQVTPLVRKRFMALEGLTPSSERTNNNSLYRADDVEGALS